MELLQKQEQKLSQQQIQSAQLLQMSTQELEAYVRELSLENPMVEPEEPQSSAPPEPERDELLGRLRWLEDNDRQNLFYQHVVPEELDPLARAATEGGLEETLLRFLSRQLHRMELDEDTAQTVRYLASCLDDSGYFRIPLEELSRDTGVSAPRLERALDILQSLEPAGVGARDLSECLVLQLRRIRETGPALDIVRDHLELLAARRYQAIAGKLGVPVEEVRRAEGIIRELDPRPGAIFQHPEQTVYLLPDVFVEEEDGALIVRARREERPPFRISGEYRRLLEQSEDREVREYLTGKLRQAEQVLWAVGQRESTVLRCARVVADYQREFFRSGPAALRPLRMADVAEELGLHESTVSRAVKGKYLQCVRGIYPLSYFFSRSVAPGVRSGAVGGEAARALLRRLIQEEDKTSPLSDQQLCRQMAEEGCPLSRRTVAKYREELGIPAAYARREQEG